MGERYATPAAFRRALTDRLKQAAEDGPWTLQQLQRQVAYDRLLDRLYSHDDGWIVKGATALLARDLGVRGSLDINIYRKAAREVADGICAKPPTQTGTTGFVSRWAGARPSATMHSGCRSTRSLEPRPGSDSTLILWEPISA